MVKETDKSTDASCALGSLTQRVDDAKLSIDPDELTEMTKADLYDRAQDVDIEGRSTMTKAELVAALQRA